MHSHEVHAYIHIACVCVCVRGSYDSTKTNYASYSLYYFCTVVVTETNACVSCGQKNV